MADYSQAFPLIAQNEGGYADVSGDTGGETYAGITRKNFPSWSGWAIVDANKPIQNGHVIPDAGLESDVQAFYKANFWDTVRLTEINSQRVANFTFDWNVNSGAWAVKALQTAVGVTADGAVGPQTIAAVNQADESTLMNTLIQARISFYNHIVENNPSQEKFLNGWIARAKSFEQ